MKKTLHLNLKRVWFDMIKSGEKKEEYRNTRPYWASRLINKSDNYVTIDFWKGFLGRYIEKNGKVSHEYGFKDQGSIDYILAKCKGFKEYDTITFSNGYAKDRDQFEIELKGISIKEGNPDWGAEPGKKYFVLELGNLI